MTKTLFSLAFSKKFMEERNGFDAFVVIENIVLFVWRVDVIVIQTKAKQYGFQSQYAFKQSNNRNGTATACRDRVFTKSSFDSFCRCLVSRRICWRNNRLTTMMRRNLFSNA